MGVVIPLVDYFLSLAIEYLHSGKPADEIRRCMVYVVFGFLVAGSIFATTDLVRTLLFRYLGSRHMGLLKSSYYRSVLSQEPAWHDVQSSAALISRFHSTLPRIIPAYGLVLSLAIYQLGKGAWSLVFALVADVKLTLTAYSLIPLVILCFVVFGRISSQTSLRQTKAFSKASAVAAEDLGLLRTIWLFCTQPLELQR
jgi:ABC-type multidrug transport system fused ATPase/permease subunit